MSGEIEDALPLAFWLAFGSKVFIIKTLVSNTHADGIEISARLGGVASETLETS